MEVTTVSPSAISPTGGDDLCETDVPNVAIHIVALLIGLCGLAGNGAVLWLIVLNDITELIFDLAATDFLFLLLAVPSTLVFVLEDLSCSPIMPVMYLRFLLQLSVLSYCWGLFRLTPISIEIDTYKLWQLCFCCRIPKRLWWLVCSVQYWAFFALINGIPTVTFLCPSLEQGYCRGALISVYTLILLLFAAPLLISHAIDLIKGKRCSQKQQPKTSNIIIFLIVLFTLLLSLWNILQQLGYIAVSSHVVFLLTCINTSIKPFIYILVGISWRHCSVGRFWTHCTVGSLQVSFQRVFDESEENTPSSNDPAVETVI